MHKFNYVFRPCRKSLEEAKGALVLLVPCKITCFSCVMPELLLLSCLKESNCDHATLERLAALAPKDKETISLHPVQVETFE